MRPETLTWLEKQKPRLVARAERFVLDTKLFEANAKTADRPKGERDPHVKTSQIRNLLGAAQAGEPLAVLVNFLRYQLGRRKGWPHEDSGQALEALFTGDLRALVEEWRAADAAAAAEAQRESKADPESEADDRYEVESYLAAQLLGFIVREYTYRCALAGTRP